MNPHVFREYDIRGVVDKDFPPPVVEALGRAMGTYLLDHGATRITLGRDIRLSSDRLRDDLCNGLLSTGIDVIDVGVCPTPLLYFSIHHLKAEGGIMITGSHNPPEFNGFKVCVGPHTIYGEEIQRLAAIIQQEAYRKGKGTVSTTSVIEPYQEYILSHIHLASPVKVVVDAGNGTAGLVAPELFRRLSCQVVSLYCEPDGSFPHHHPDPTVPANLVDIKERVLAERADLGVAFDGDADRIGVIDEQGTTLWGDRLLVIYSRAVLKKHPGATIISEVKSSNVLYRDIEARGGRPIMWKAGHSLIKKKMKEEHALLAGEMSGHVFFADRYFGYDDAIYAACRLFEILSEEGKPLSALIADLPVSYSTPEIRIDCPDDAKFRIIDEAVRYFRAHYEVIDVDGARVVFPDGWGLVRASNTQPVLVMRFEAESPERLEEIRHIVEERIRTIRASMNA